MQPAAVPDGAAGWNLRYGRRFRILAVIMILPLVGFHGLFIAAYMLNELTGRDFAVCICVFGLFTLGGLWLLVEAYYKQVTLDDDALVIRRLLFGPLYIPWGDINGVSYSEAWKVFKVRHGAGGCARISVYLDGLATLRLYLDRYAPGALDASAGAVMPQGSNAKDRLGRAHSSP